VGLGRARVGSEMLLVSTTHNYTRYLSALWALPIWRLFLTKFPGGSSMSFVIT
jgi:hypothetical protein